MVLPSPHPGLVLRYSYLWRSEYGQGREEGVKDRPCVVVLITEEALGDFLVTVAPITHAPPRAPDDAIEIPHTTKRRLGLDDEQAWVVVTEVNRFIWLGPDLRPLPAAPGRFDYGTLPPDFFTTVRDRIRKRIAERTLRSTPRTE